METPSDIRNRWIYLRDLLLEQLARFETGSLQIHADGENVSPDAITRLRRNIFDFDQMIARNLARERADG